jgi:hypothetical protein
VTERPARSGEEPGSASASVPIGESDHIATGAHGPEAATTQLKRRRLPVARIRALVRAIEDGEDSRVEEAVLELSRSRRLLAPLAFLVGAFVMLFRGVQLLFSNWRLTLIEILPAMWIWLAMLDFKAHLLRGKSFLVLRGPILIPLILVIAAITAASLFLNAVFAFAVARPGSPDISRALVDARSRVRVIVGWGLVIGIGLGVSTTVFPRWGRWWFAVSLSVVIGVMMIAYVSVPARLLGLKTARSKRDQVSATVIGGSIGAVVCTPPYVLGRVGILMLGSHVLLVPGIFVLTLGVTLQAGASGAVNALKMSATLLTRQSQEV